MPPKPLATPACLGWPLGLATALNDNSRNQRSKLEQQQIDTRVDTQRRAQERALHDALRFSVVPTSRNKHMLLKIKVGNVKIVLSMR